MVKIAIATVRYQPGTSSAAWVTSTQGVVKKNVLSIMKKAVATQNEQGCRKVMSGKITSCTGRRVHRRGAPSGKGAAEETSWQDAPTYTSTEQPIFRRGLYYIMWLWLEEHLETKDRLRRWRTSKGI